jgi:superfamily I DNA and/or RNA helicase
MNVAITRARRHLFVVGDSGTLGRHPFYARFIEHAEAHGGYRSAWEWPGAVDPQSR